MNANESRRRVDLGPNPASDTKPKIDNTLPYHGKELGNDSIRLVEIHPAEHDGDPVVCTLCDVKFGSRPKFEALSYRWGTETADDVITLNHHPVEIGKNLLDALVFLRRQVTSGAAPQLFWIDAICINRNDVEERNQQLRIMDQIYIRASTVVVWLGSNYTRFQRDMVGKIESDQGESRDEGSSQGGNSIQQEMVRHLRTDPYWDRLWILQEIGHAEMLRVCFGAESLSWESFMHLITMHNGDGNTGPLRLDRLLRQEKYNDSHTLKRLLEEHEDAKCSEPRDKVYGLVGLASDAGLFPMDYSKSLYDVWKDTMVFMNKWGLFKHESNILPIGALVKNALMKNHGDPLSQISSEHNDEVDSTQLIEDQNSCLVFDLKAVPLGCIIHVGPSASDIVSRPEEASKWRTATQQLFPASDLGPAHREHDSLLRALLGSTDAELERMCFNRPSSVLCFEDRLVGRHSFPAHAGTYIEEVPGSTEAPAFDTLHPPQQATDRLASVQPRLYLAKEYRGCSTSRKMGVASGLARLGDLVCWVHSSRRALLVRTIGVVGRSLYKLRVFGTALATEDVCGTTPDYAQRWKSLEGKWATEVRVDAGTIFMLLE